MIKKKQHSFFQHKDCEYFPCHKELKVEEFNCLFCFCPLYSLGDECGGNFNYENDEGVKDCSNCVLPHRRNAYDYVIEKCKKICKLTKKK